MSELPEELRAFETDRFELLKEKAESPDPLLRSFGIMQLGGLGTGEAADALINIAQGSVRAETAYELFGVKICTRRRRYETDDRVDAMRELGRLALDGNSRARGFLRDYLKFEARQPDNWIFEPIRFLYAPGFLNFKCCYSPDPEMGFRLRCVSGAWKYILPLKLTLGLDEEDTEVLSAYFGYSGLDRQIGHY